MSFEPAIITTHKGVTIIGRVNLPDEENVIVKDALNIEMVGVNKMKANAIFLAFLPVNILSSDSIYLLKRKDILTIQTPSEAVFKLYLENLQEMKTESIKFEDFGTFVRDARAKAEAEGKPDPESVITGDKVVDILHRFQPKSKH